MFGQKKRTTPQQNDRPKPASKVPGTSRVKTSLLSLESRLMFDAAATATAAEVNQEQVAQEQAESAVSAEGSGEPTAVENESQELLRAITTYNPGESRTEIVFVDPTVQNYQELLSGMDPNIAVIMLDGGQDGVEQMASALAGRTGIDAIHLISHGGAGELQLGTGTLTTESMSGQYADELAIIQQALSGQADILVYGCDFAEGQAGQEAATLLSQLTGADVAASTDATGFAALGGDWVLETQIGTIETQIAVDDGIQANWVGLLAAPEVDLNAGGVGNTVTTAFTEQTSVLIAPVGTLSDVDSANLNQLSVTLTARPNGNAVESLSLNAAATVASGAGLTVSYTASTGVLLITGTASTATYQTILQGILYNNTSDQPTTSNRSITVVARDSTNASSTSRTATITVTAVNDASTIASLSGDSRAYSEGAGAVVIESGNALVADVDSTNFDTGTLTVSIPTGGDSAEDVLSIRNQGTGAGQIGVSGSTVTYQGVTIGTFTGGSSGSNLVITLNSSATPTAVTTLVRNITYQNTDTNAPTTGARTVRFVLTDGDGGTSPNYDTTVTVSAVNDAPVLADTTLSLTVGEDAGVPSGAVGSLISTFTGGITDVDSGASKGLAITGSNQTNGIWYYTRNGGTTWTAVGTVSNTSALLLADNASTRLYFAPNANYNGTSTAALTVRAWDQSSGTAGTKVSTATNGGITAFSSATDTVDVTVTAVNDGPTIASLSGDSRAYSEGAGAVVIESGNALVADVDSPNFDTGTLTVSIPAGGDSAEDVLSIRNQGTGAGQIGVSGSTVTYQGVTIGTFTGGSSGSNLVITLNSGATPTAVTALVRNITYQNTDTNAPTTGARTVRFVLTDGDGGTSPNYDTTVTVSAVNDAPVLADTTLSLTVGEDAGVPSGAVGSLISTFTGGITDVDSGASKGLAITGSNQTNGIWYYTRNGGTTWTAVGTVSNTSALLLADNASTRLYFAPNANYNGTSSAALTVRAWDQSSGTAGTKVSTATNGGITAFSSATDTVDVTVTAVNDAPTIASLSGDSLAYSEGDGEVVIEQSGNALVADVDSTNLDTGTLIVSIPAGGDSAEDVLSIRHQGTEAGQIGVSGSTVTYQGVTIGTFTGGSSGNNLAITLNSNATPTAVTALVRNITYQNTDTNAPTTGARTVRFVLTDGDGGTSPNYDTTVTVSAVNDAPTDLSLSANSVAENVANGTVVGLVTGTDPDTGDTQSYSLTDTAGGRFAINASTGEIIVADGTLLDYESATSHSVTVRVTDAGGLTYDETFTINLTNVNEAPTDLALSANSVAENASNGTVVGIVTGTDPDTGDTQTYSLTNTAGGRFAINSVTGELTVADGTLLDYESATSHTVTVRVTDAGGLTYDETFAINLTNVNETPTDLSLSANSVAENASNGTVVGIVTGTDPDSGDTQSYSLTDTAGGRFAINSATGAITVADGTLLDYESATSHSVTVRVTDAGGLTYDETFVINLTNVNETPSSTGQESNTVIALLGAAKPVDPAVERANTIREVEVHPLDDLGMVIDVRPEPAFSVDASMTPAKDRPHLAHTAVVEQAAILGGKQNLHTSSDKRERIAVNLDATGNQDVVRPESHNPTVQTSEEMKKTSDESSGLDMPMATGLAGMMLLHGRTGMKDKLTVMSRRIRGLPQGPPSDTKSGDSNEDEVGSVLEEFGNDHKV